MSEVALTTCNATMAVAKLTPDGNYAVTGTNGTVELERDIDFGVIPGTKSPSLFKPGAEKVIMAYQLMVRYSIESAVEQLVGKETLCFYRVRCDLVKGFVDGNGQYREVVYANGYGNANTAEKRNGMNSTVNAANSTLKMAMKRSLTSAALGVSGLSSMFTQDVEDQDASIRADEILNTDKSAKIGKNEFNRIKNYATFNLGWNKDEIGSWLSAEFGVEKSSDLTLEQFDKVMEKLSALAAEKEKK